MLDCGRAATRRSAVGDAIHVHVTVTADTADTVREFYGRLLGWTIGPDTNPGPYNGWIMEGEPPWASVIEATDATTGRWIPYIEVDDLDVAVDKATSLGVAVVAGKADGPPAPP